MDNWLSDGTEPLPRAPDETLFQSQYVFPIWLRMQGRLLGGSVRGTPSCWLSRSS